MTNDETIAELGRLVAELYVGAAYSRALDEELTKVVAGEAVEYRRTLKLTQAVLDRLEAEYKRGLGERSAPPSTSYSANLLGDLKNLADILVAIERCARGESYANFGHPALHAVEDLVRRRHRDLDDAKREIEIAEKCAHGEATADDPPLAKLVTELYAKTKREEIHNAGLVSSKADLVVLVAEKEEALRDLEGEYERLKEAYALFLDKHTGFVTEIERVAEGAATIPPGIVPPKALALVADLFARASKAEKDLAAARDREAALEYEARRLREKKT